MSKYINVGSITAVMAAIIGVITIIYPKLGPNFESDAKTLVGQIVLVVSGVIGLWDEIKAAKDANK